MLLEDEIIEIKITYHSRIKYEKILNTTIKTPQLISIKQKDVLPTSRTMVKCKCDYCNEIFEKRRVDVNNKTFCNNICRNNNLKNNNPNPSVVKIKVKCESCNIDFKVFPSVYKKQKYFLCSRECYKIHRSKNYSKDNVYNYQDIIVTCDNSNCTNKFKICEYDTQLHKHHFCKAQCYWDHRSEKYIEHYYSPDLNNNRKETNPEKKVRIWLEEHNIKFIQEEEFLKKYFVDFYLPEYGMVIEVFGDYWHVNPKFYGEGKKDLTKQQIGRPENDIIRVEEIENHGVKVNIIWEDDINTDLNYHMLKIFNSKPQRLHANPLQIKGEDIV